MRASDSAMPSTTVITHAFAASFSRDASPAAPSHSVREPIASNTGVTRSRTSCGPDASTTSAPSSAGLRVPSTGASTYATPRSRASATSRSLPSTPTVLCCTQTAPGARDARACSMVAATASASNSMVRTRSAPSTASAGLSATTAPTPARGSAFSRLRFHTRSGSPARAMLAAMPAPMVPVPSRATVGFVVMPAHLPGPPPRHTCDRRDARAAAHRARNVVKAGRRRTARVALFLVSRPKPGLAGLAPCRLCQNTGRRVAAKSRRTVSAR